MKRLLLTTVLAVTLLAVIGLNASDVEIADYYHKDSVTVLDTVQETDTSKAVWLYPPGNDRIRPYDAAIGFIYAATPDSVGGALGDSVGLSDSVIITLCTQWRERVDTIKVDTLLTPDTMKFEYWADYDYVKTGDTNLIAADSSGDSAWSGAVYVPTDNPSPHKLLNDKMFYIATAYDSTTADDTVRWVLDWYVRLIER